MRLCTVRVWRRTHPITHPREDASPAQRPGKSVVLRSEKKLSLGAFEKQCTLGVAVPKARKKNTVFYAIVLIQGFTS